MASGKWWEYLVPGLREYRLTQDVTGALSGQGSYDKRAETAKSNLDYWKSQKPGEYKSEYEGQIKDTQNQLNKMNEDGFSYDYTKDTAYQQYKNRYTKGAELASEDATARAAARSGGYGNSWGTSSGQSAYQSTMNGLSDVADSLYSQAYSEWGQKKNDLSNKISALNEQETLAQNAYQTKMDNYWNQLQNATNEYNNATNSAQQNRANTDNFWGNLAKTAATMLPDRKSVV